MKHNLLKSVILSVILLMGVSNAWAATQRYIYVGISNEYQNNKEGNSFGLNVWGGTSGGVKTLIWIQDNYNWDGRNYTIYRAQVYDDNNKAQFKGNDNWWEGECNVTLNGTTNNAIFFSHKNDGWQGQFQQNYQVTSSASLAASRTSVLVGDNVTLTPSLTSEATYNTLKSTNYEISPNTGASISSNTFKATKAGTYTVTATVTYNAKDFTGITKTATATQTIKVYDTQYVLRGSQTANGDPKGGMAGWEATNNNAYTSATINGTTMTIVATLTNAKTQYKFKIYNNFDGSDYGQTGSAEIPDNESWTLNGRNDVLFTTTAAGPYTFIYNTSNKSIKVQYPTAYTVTYSRVPTAAANAPTTSPSISSGAYVLANTSVTFNAKAANTGYKWKGWYDNNAGTGNALSPNLAYTRSITANTTIYAIYTANTYTVKFDANGGSGTMSDQNFTYGTSQNLTANAFTRTGYTFAGWATSANGNKAYNDNQSVSNLSSTNGATVTLYAKWTANTYQVKFNGNGNTSGSMSNQSFTYDEAAKALTTNAFKKTGYTFAGWNTAANGSGTSYADKATVRNLTTTNNATINLYAKWTINQYTLTYSAGEGGSVTATVGGQEISSPATLPYNTSVKLTATPEGENAFAQWVNGNGVKVSTNNPYELTLTGNTTIKAEFSKPTTVYLKPSNAWKEHNAHFAIYSWGESDSWVEMEAVDCEGDYYKANVPAGFSDFAFVRLKPVGADGYSDVNGGHNWDNKLDQTGNLTVQTNGKNMYDANDNSFIHLEPKAWDDGYARFAAYFYNNNDNNEWVNLTKNTSVNGNIYSGEIPKGKNYTHVIFCRMDINNQTNNFDVYWHKTKNLSLMDNGDNCFWVNTDGDWNSNKEQADGGWYRVLDNNQWKNFTTPTYDVILEPFQYGQYGVNINGKTYYSKPSEQVVIENVALGTQVKLIDAVSNTPHYGHKLDNSDNRMYESAVVVRKNSTSSTNYHISEDTEFTHTVCGTTTFRPNMVTTAPHRVYLHIPANCINSWNSNANLNCVYATEYLTNSGDGRPGALVVMTRDDYLSSLDNGDYYYCDIPKGYHYFYFERKEAADNSSPKNKTIPFNYEIPLTNLNCFNLDGNTDNGNYTGNWDVMPTSVGDYRLLYVEQVVEKDDWKTVINRTLQHPSDIVKPYTQDGTHTDIVSLHIYKDKEVNGETVNPEVILQKCTAASYNNGNGEWTYTWEDIEAHMVNGPLEADAGMAMLPGRKNAGENSSCDDFVYDDGIEIIKNDNEPGRVWNFTIQQTVENGNTTATLLLDSEEHLYPYEGKYYIRTNNAEGGWSNYTIPGSHMTFSSYAKEHSGYSHYYCKWVNIDPNNTIGTHKNVKFIVANDYGVAISEELHDDSFTQDDGTLQQNANVRWSWNETTNEAKRAYIKGSSVPNYLTVTITDNESETEDTPFVDNGNWIYEANIDAQVGEKLTAITAPYHTSTQSLLEERYQEGLVMLTGDPSDKIYDVRIMFDFKINKTTVLLVPNANEATTAIDVLIERVNHGQATQVQLNAPVTAAEQENGYIVHAAMTFTEGNVANLNNNKSQRLFYWVSFPFDVQISEVFGFGEYGVHWIMQYYDGEERAKNGAWADSPTYWRYITDTTSVEGQYDTESLNCGILKANQGYVLALATNIANMGVFEHTDQVTLYFPSRDKITNINANLIETEVTLEKYQCTIERDNRKVKDSNWHLIGIPSYSDKTFTLGQEDVLYYYVRNYLNDNYAVTKTGEVNFQSMHSYFVQFAGTINWTAENTWTLQREQLAARRNANHQASKHTLRVELQQNDKKADQTYVTLHEEATPAFDMNKDLTKVINSGANIYSLITTESTPIQVAGNVLPDSEAIIPLGIKITAAGEYTFAMPDGTDGIIVELIDYETNTRTNMLLDEYTVNLGKGTFESRFALHVRPDKTVTSLDNIGDETIGDQVKKFLIDGVLYMQKDGALYDAQGRCVQ